jgi:hypothetical protein
LEFSLTKDKPKSTNSVPTYDQAHIKFSRNKPIGYPVESSTRHTSVSLKNGGEGDKVFGIRRAPETMNAIINDKPAVIRTKETTSYFFYADRKEIDIEIFTEPNIGFSFDS